MTALAGRGAKGHVVGRRHHRGRCPHPAHARAVAGRTGHTWHRRVIHRRALVSDYKTREGGGAGRGIGERWAGGEVVEKGKVGHRGGHVSKGLAAAGTL